ncbi:MAG: glycosyltransferase [Nitrospirae bacterium]|nr:MAG: glycosyltransferase [Nitrospirota bacterium]
MLASAKKAPELSVVVPVYNSARIFPELHKRLVGALEGSVESFEIIAVLDGCRDNSLDVIGSLSQKDGRIKVIEFSRNFGHQAAITAGLNHAAGRLIAIIDDDLEDPPEILNQFIAKTKEGFDVVFGIRKKRKRSLPLRMLYSMFYRISGKLVDIDIPRDAGDFCVMTRRVVEVLLSMPENNRYLRGMRAWSGFKQTGVEYEREGRFADNSGYNLRKYFALALNGIFSFSYRPLKYVTFIGIFIAMLSFAEGARVLYLKLTDKMFNVPGWTSLSLSILFFSGVQLIALGIIGEYIARIYDEVKQRPKYVIRTKIGLDEEQS